MTEQSFVQVRIDSKLKQDATDVLNEIGWIKALEACDDVLRLAINLAFSCSLRMGENIHPRMKNFFWSNLKSTPTTGALR